MHGSLKDGAVSAPFVTSSVEQLWLATILRQASSASGVAVTPLRALGVATVYACVNKLSSTIATLPLQVYRRRADGGKELDHEHPLYDLLHVEPNKLMSSVSFRMAMEGHRSLRNNALAIITRDRGSTHNITPVNPEDVTDVRLGVDGQQLVYSIKGSSYFQDEVLHLKGATRDGVVGLDLISTVHDVLGLAIALEENASKFFRNGSRPGGVLSHPALLSQQAYDRLKSEMESKHQGIENAYKMMILEEGLKFEAQREANKDSQFDESRDRQDRAIARVFGVPPHKVGINTNMPRANMEQENIGFVVDTIRPICVIWEQELNRKLLSKEERRTHFIEFNLSALLRGDLAARYESYAKARQWGWLCVDEIRALENLNPLPDGSGKVYLQPMNMHTAGKEGELTNK